MKKVVSLVLHWTYFLLVVCASSYLTFQIIQHTAWYKDRLYTQLVNGDPRHRTKAAITLARVGGQEQLLDALKVDTQPVREIAQRALEHIWFTAAGDEAYQLSAVAHEAAESGKYDEALKILNQLVQKYPGYAEGWNRRASVYWQMGEHQKSMADCERVLALNPHHYGAWQGVGICQLKLGNILEACRALREALKITPYNEATRRSLRRCEDLLRVYPNPAKAVSSYQLI